MKNILIPVLMAVFLITACSKPESPGIEYAPDMYHSLAYDPLSQKDPNTLTKDKKNMIEPVSHTIARGHLMYQYALKNTPEDYELAGTSVKNPLQVNEENIAAGKVLFTNYCQVCHGENGMADGPIVAAGKFPPPPAYNSPKLKELPEGKMFHSITYGKNLMGSYASQLNPEERWKVIMFVQTLQKQ